jgi:Flp pilus assembly protein TadD
MSGPESRPISSSLQQQQDIKRSPSRNESSKPNLAHALLLIDHGEYKLAQNILRSTLAIEPQNHQAMRWLGYCFDQAKDFKNALICYKQWNKLEPSEQSFFQLGISHLSNSNFPQARESLHQALALIDYESPNLFEIYKHLGNLALRSGDIEGAEELYNRAYTLSPHSDVLMVNIGTLEIQKGNWTQAADHFRKAVELNQQNDNAWIGLAMAYRSLSDFDLAWGALEKALDLNPLNLIGLRLIVEWALSDSKYDSAILRLKIYMGDCSHDSDMSFCLATLLFKSGHIRESKFELQRTRELAPDREDVIQLEVLLKNRMEA